MGTTTHGRVSYPPAAPADLLRHVDFIEQMNARMRELRDSSALPRTPVTMPDEFDETFAKMVTDIRAQATAALEHGEPLAVITFDATDDFIELARWGMGRLELIAGLIRAGMVQPEWQEPLTFLLHVSEHVWEQLEPGDAKAG